MALVKYAIKKQVKKSSYFMDKLTHEAIPFSINAVIFQYEEVAKRYLKEVFPMGQDFLGNSVFIESILM